MNIKCIIVDDEPLARKGLEEFISKTPFLDHCASLGSAYQALSYLKSNKVDVMLLDIQMPDMTGLELIKVLSNPPKVIFTTAYREFALDGFELNALDYLLKPISYDRFLKAINKALPSFNGIGTENNHIFVKSNGMIVKIPLKNILYVESAKDYIFIYTPKSRYMALVSLKHIEESLDDTNFMRVHRSYLVGIRHVEKIEGNLLYIKGNKIQISRKLRTEVYQRIIGNRLIER